MKRRLVLFCTALFFCCFILFNASATESKIPKPIKELLSGKNTDVDGVLSGIDDSSLPLVLTICDILKHKALHKETKLTPEAVDRFKTMVEKRLETSSVVSFKKSPEFPQRIPAKEIDVEGKRIVVPEHYLAPAKFSIVDVAPQGEAGTLFPDILVIFTAGKQPIESKVLLDGRKIECQETENVFVYRPPLKKNCLLKIGSHTVDVVLTDASGQVASTSWSFSVGSGPSEPEEELKDAETIGSLTVPLQTIFPESPFPGQVRILIQEDKDGKRAFSYTILLDD